MKKILIALIFVAGGLCASAQSGKTIKKQTVKTIKNKPKPLKKGERPKVAANNGPHDVTPGSPVGTGGAGSNMSGSSSSSAIKSGLKKQQMQARKDTLRKGNN